MEKDFASGGTSGVSAADTNFFDPFIFDGVEEEKSAKAKGGESNPWSDSTWGGISELLSTTRSRAASTQVRAAATHTTNDRGTNNADGGGDDDDGHQVGVGDTSFEYSNSIFDFSSPANATAAEEGEDGTSRYSTEFMSLEFGFNPFAGANAKARDCTLQTSKKERGNNNPTNDHRQELFPSDPMATLSGEESAVETGETTVRITILEELSTVYDDAGNTPSSYLEGTIFVSSFSWCDLQWCVKEFVPYLIALQGTSTLIMACSMCCMGIGQTVCHVQRRKGWRRVFYERLFFSGKGWRTKFGICGRNSTNATFVFGYQSRGYSLSCVSAKEFYTRSADCKLYVPSTTSSHPIGT